MVNIGLKIGSKSLNSASRKENSSASLIRMVGSDACTFTCLRYPKKMSSAEIKENYWPSISSSGPYEAGEQYRYLFVIVVVVFCGDLYHYQRMHTVRLVTMDYTSLNLLIVHNVSCLMQVRSVIYQMFVIIFHYNV